MDFSIGLGHICLLRDDGVVECAGDDSHGQASPPPSARYVELDGGDYHTCGLWENGEVECWGSIAGTFSKDALPALLPPTPMPTLGATTSPLPTPTLVPGEDSCMETLSANGSVIGEWEEGGCRSETEARDGSGGYPYARYYSFTLAQESDLTITLELVSGEADTYLYLREEEAKVGEALHENDDHEGSTSKSQIQVTLTAGTYTIEATTYPPSQTGLFTLSVGGL